MSDFRFNQTLCASLTKLINDEQNDWDQNINPVLIAYRTAEHKSTKHTPYYLAYLREPRLLVEEQFPVSAVPDLTNQASIETAVERRIEAAISLLGPCVHKKAHANIQVAQQQQKRYFDEAHAPPAYKMGDLVLLNNAQRQQRQGGKLKPKWTGPYRITEVKPKGIYRLEGRRALVNAMRIKVYKSTSTSPDPQKPTHHASTPHSEEPAPKGRRLSCEETGFQPPPPL